YFAENKRYEYVLQHKFLIQIFNELLNRIHKPMFWASGQNIGLCILNSGFEPFFALKRIK
ncbi:MAG: hypothetical protein K2G23_05615, partial [Muribaculaceae bacterium]|nr:hypothetical protein [Muribaculaceae bacterium]